MTQVIRTTSDNPIIIAQNSNEHQVHIVEHAWYFHQDDVDASKINITNRTYTCPYKGVCYWVDIIIDGQIYENLAWMYPTAKAGYDVINNRIGFYERETSLTVAEVLATA